MAITQQLVAPKMVYIHLETSNQSFIDMRNYLKAKGIQNNDFFLALLDPGLAGVDPRDPNLSPVMKARVLQECYRNYWYFLREVVRIPDQGGDVNGGKRYKLHRGNLAMNFLFILNYNQFDLLPRQHGKTVGAVCRYLWVYNFGTTNSEIMFIHKAHDGSKSNLKKLKEIRDALPSYLQMSSVLNADGKKLKVPNTVVSMQHPTNNNKITTFPSARTKDAANNLGRGATMPMQFYDEFAFMPYNKEVYLAAVPAFSTASTNAKSHGAPYGLLITTTPGYLTTDSGQYAYHIYEAATPWNEMYYDYSFQQLEDLKNSNHNSNFFAVKYSYQQLGSGPDYFSRMVIEMGKDWDSIRREVLLEWSDGSGNCPFSDEDLEIIKSHLKDPIRTVLFGRYGQYQFQVYEDVDTSYPPIIGVDVAGALWQDSSAITVIDSKTTRVTATLNCNYMPSDDLAEVLYELMTKYLPNAICSIERNGGFGVSVIQRLVKTSVKKNLYWNIKDKVIEESFNGIRSIKRSARVKVYGVDSNKEVRARLIELLYDRVRYHKDKFVAPIIFDEMQKMEVKKNGKVEHSSNSHDDQVFSYLHALYVWYDGENLAERYGIQKNTIRTDDDEEIVESEYEDQLEKTEKVDMTSLEYDNDSDIQDAINFVNQNNNIITSKDLREQTYIREIQLRDTLLANNRDAREAYARDRGLDPSMFVNNTGGNRFVQLPDNLFASGISDDIFDFDDDNSLYKNNQTNLAGNLANMWDKI